MDVKRVSQNHSPTSVAAAESMAGKAGTLRRQVFDYIQDNNGATDEECALALDVRRTTAGARRVELVDAGLVVDSGKTRKTLSGRCATVWERKKTNIVHGKVDPRVGELHEHDPIAYRAWSIIQSHMPRAAKKAVWDDLTDSQKEKVRGLL